MDSPKVLRSSIIHLMRLGMLLGSTRSLRIKIESLFPFRCRIMNRNLTSGQLFSQPSPTLCLLAMYPPDGLGCNTHHSHAHGSVVLHYNPFEGHQIKLEVTVSKKDVCRILGKLSEFTLVGTNNWK